MTIVPGAPDELAGVDLDLWALGGFPDREDVDQAQGVEAVLLPRVSRGEDLGLLLPVLLVLHGEAHHGEALHGIEDHYVVGECGWRSRDKVEENLCPILGGDEHVEPHVEDSSAQSCGFLSCYLPLAAPTSNLISLIDSEDIWGWGVLLSSFN